MCVHLAPSPGKGPARAYARTKQLPCQALSAEIQRGKAQDWTLSVWSMQYLAGIWGA